MSANEIKNVLVVGNSGNNIVKFVKLFAAYLQYNSYEEAKELHPNLSKTEQDNVFKSTNYVVGNLNLICAHTLENALVVKQVLSVVLDFTVTKSLNAIIILLKLDPSNVVYLKKLKAGLFHSLKEFNDNILYVYALDANNFNYQNCLIQDEEIFERKANTSQKQNKFYFQEDVFYTISNSNWKQGVCICKTINNYINALPTFYFRCVTSVESVLNLIDNLLELLIQIYISSANSDGSLQISKFKRNTTVCYGKQCIQMLQDIPHAKICHASCYCKSNNKTKCIIFETPNNKCIQCNCNVNFHSDIYFKYDNSFAPDRGLTLRLVVALAIFYVYKKSQKAENNFDDIFLKMFDREHLKSIYDNFKIKFEEEVKFCETRTISFGIIVQCLRYLCHSNTPSKEILQEFLEEIVPEDFKLEMIQNNIEFAEQSKTKIKHDASPSCEIAKKDEIIYENQILKKDIAELNRKMDQLLSLNKSLLLKENSKIND